MDLLLRMSVMDVGLTDLLRWSMRPWAAAAPMVFVSVRLLCICALHSRMPPGASGPRYLASLKLSTILRKSLYYKVCRKPRHIVKHDKYDWYNATQFLSYTGWFKYTDTKYAYKQLTQYIDIPKLKHSVSAHSRREHI